MNKAPPPEVRQTLAPTGKLRVGVYPGSPFSLLRDPAGGEKGVVIELGRALAARLGVPCELAEYQRIAQVLDALKAGRVDLALANASPARIDEFAWSQPVLLVELGYLVMPDSKLKSPADADTPGMRIGVTEGGTTHSRLAQTLKHARAVPAATLDGAIALLEKREIDAYTTNKPNLFQMSDRLPGSRVLDGRWGVERITLALPKDSGNGIAFLNAFIDEAKASGLIAGAAARAGLRGIAVD